MKNSETPTTIDKLIEVAHIIVPYYNDSEVEEKLSEIISLTESAEAIVDGYTVQKIREINPSTFIGKGKLEEINQNIGFNKVNLIVFDGELSPSQTLNMSDALGGIKVIDRTTLILDIFAKNAKTNEGKIQVELAQLKYIYPRLKGKGSALSKLGGGIGTRGPGETQLETDRRHIRTRINSLEKDLKEIQKRRNLYFDRRNRNNVKSISIIGYTNAGKSTLLNLLTGSEVLVENKLFATLDPTVKKFNLDKYTVLLSDTVGFVKNIPTNLIEAFKSTLETAIQADLILLVNEPTGDWLTRLETCHEVLKELNCTAPIINVFNKMDLIKDFSGFPTGSIFISAKTGENISQLKNRIISSLDKYFSTYIIKLPYDKINDFRALSKYCQSVNYDYCDYEVKVTFCVSKENESKFKDYI